MSTEALGAAPVAAPPPAQDTFAGDAQAKDEIECAPRPQPTFLHSPPDSNNATKSDASDSELSDLEDEPVLGDAPLPGPQPEVEDDIGEVLPDHWSGAVPVFKPSMDQFKDFKRFVRYTPFPGP